MTREAPIPGSRAQAPTGLRAASRISLAGWSLHRAIERGDVRGLDLPRIARVDFGIDAVELVNTLLESSDDRAMRHVREQAGDHGVEVLLLMVDDEGDLSANDARERRRAVESHRRWIDAAARLGCRAIRVNTGGGPEVEGAMSITGAAVARAIDRVADSLARLCDLAAPAGLDVLIENHGGLSSNVDAVLELLRRAARPNLGTLPDFGNFPPGADVHGAIEKLAPHARAVSAKCFDFDEEGNETTLDYPRLIGIVDDAGYRGWLGIEYEGARLTEPDGIRACQRLLMRLL